MPPPPVCTPPCGAFSSSVEEPGLPVACFSSQVFWPSGLSALACFSSQVSVLPWSGESAA